MQLKAEQLPAHLAKNLSAVYAVHGDEPLLALEAADAVRAAARKRDFAEREVLEAGRGFDWSEFRHAAENLSLFGGRKIVELRLPSGKVPAPIAKGLAQYCANPNPDTLLLVTMPRPEGAGWWKSDWFAALDRAGVIVEVSGVPRAQLPRWLAGRLARHRQNASVEVLAFLAERVEGNLLAAHQEVEKLALLAPEGELAMDTVQDAVASVARYDPNGAAEALLAGDAARYVRVLEGLRGEGEQPTFILFVLSAMLFVLQGALRGQDVDSLAMQHRLFAKPVKAAIQAAVSARRFQAPKVAAAIAHAALVDRAIKGVQASDPWQELIRLGLNLAHGSKA
ncbi:MAG: DNA polymerase III subunit delta [Betaproteobacteria bacterium]|nr:DNA polymerase III subunit delta [Betaproteobacteria bacterium]